MLLLILSPIQILYFSTLLILDDYFLNFTVTHHWTRSTSKRPVRDRRTDGRTDALVVANTGYLYSRLY